MEHAVEGLLCDNANGEYNMSAIFRTNVGCTPFGNAISSGSSWTVTGNTAYAGKLAATTKVYFLARLNDFKTGSTYDPVNPSPSLVPTGKSLTVNYIY